jgi:hypothetical protein
LTERAKDICNQEIGLQVISQHNSFIGISLPSLFIDTGINRDIYLDYDIYSISEDEEGFFNVDDDSEIVGVMTIVLAVVTIPTVVNGFAMSMTIKAVESAAPIHTIILKELPTEYSLEWNTIDSISMDDSPVVNIDMIQSAQIPPNEEFVIYLDSIECSDEPSLLSYINISFNENSLPLTGRFNEQDHSKAYPRS